MSMLVEMDDSREVGSKERKHSKNSLREVYVWCETATQLFKSSPLPFAQRANVEL